jgi:hypothetical protein
LYIFAEVSDNSGIVCMVKIIKSIRAFFLLFAALVIVVHMIIPHDHHFAASVSGLKDSCPFSQHKSEHHPFFPAHCHAFNDLASEKLRTFHVSQNIQFIFISFTNLFNTSAFQLQASCVSIIDLLNPILDSFTLASSHLRAPPSLT